MKEFVKNLTSFLDKASELNFDALTPEEIRAMAETVEKGSFVEMKGQTIREEDYVFTDIIVQIIQMIIQQISSPSSTSEWRESIDFSKLNGTLSIGKRGKTRTRSKSRSSSSSSTKKKRSNTGGSNSDEKLREVLMRKIIELNPGTGTGRQGAPLPATDTAKMFIEGVEETKKLEEEYKVNMKGIKRTLKFSAVQAFILLIFIRFTTLYMWAQAQRTMIQDVAGQLIIDQETLAASTNQNQAVNPLYAKEAALTIFGVNPENVNNNVFQYEGRVAADILIGDAKPSDFVVRLMKTPDPIVQARSTYSVVLLYQQSDEKGRQTYQVLQEIQPPIHLKTLLENTLSQDYLSTDQILKYFVRGQEEITNNNLKAIANLGSLASNQKYLDENSIREFDPSSMPYNPELVNDPYFFNLEDLLKKALKAISDESFKIQGELKENTARLTEQRRKGSATAVLTIEDAGRGAYKTAVSAAQFFFGGEETLIDTAGDMIENLPDAQGVFDEVVESNRDKMENFYDFMRRLTKYWGRQASKEKNKYKTYYAREAHVRWQTEMGIYIIASVVLLFSFFVRQYRVISLANALSLQIEANNTELREILQSINANGNFESELLAALRTVKARIEQAERGSTITNFVMGRDPTADKRTEAEYNSMIQSLRASRAITSGGGKFKRKKKNKKTRKKK